MYYQSSKRNEERSLVSSLMGIIEVTRHSSFLIIKIRKNSLKEDQGDTAKSTEIQSIPTV